ncbi:hypothetical protein EUX98_g1054 [Antrodiella citrinella]|uniref:Ketoreductase domain-containing protein n=1 Tax=Antrodiella citrinella TaxID=2447956 RepID=A0A4S4N5H6_9APHY|nr:hypothetical protein EUX98_g1054 [Antrodiella citrinella]
MSTSPRVVLVTGCTKGGIGYSLSQEFARTGCIVYATARKLEVMDGLDESNIHKLVLDVTNEKQIAEVVSTIVEAEGRIDVLVNNAGMSCPGPLLDLTLEQARRIFETNTFAVLTLSRAVVPHMARRHKGVVVNVSSVMGEVPTPWMGMYAATKAALHSITETLWMECKALNVDVMLLVPGQVTSNIAVNGIAAFDMPENSLYRRYFKNILERVAYSQSAGAIPADEFSRAVVSASLSTSPPRTWVLGMFWRRWTKA